MRHEYFVPISQARALIEVMGDVDTCVIIGERGIGKTSLYYDLRKSPKFSNHIFVEPIDCSQLSDGSIMMPDIDREARVSRELPNERLGISATNRRGVPGSRPVMLFFDEFGKASRYIHNILAPIVYEHRVGADYLPDGSVVMLAMNLEVEGLGDKMQAHVEDRIIALYVSKPTLAEFSAYGESVGLNTQVMAYVQEYPQVLESFVDYEPGGPYYGQDLSKVNGRIPNPRLTTNKGATPRSLHRVGRILDRCDNPMAGIDERTLEAAIAGTVGHLVAKEFMAFRAFGKLNCSTARVFVDPMNAPVSTNAMAQRQQAMRLLREAADRAQAEAAALHISRMYAEIQGMFVQLVSGSQRKALFGTVKAFQDIQIKHKELL